MIAASAVTGRLRMNLKFGTRCVIAARAGESTSRKVGLCGRSARNALAANGPEIKGEFFGECESCDRNERLNRRLYRLLRHRDVLPDVTNLAVLLAVSVRMSVGDRVDTHCAHRKDENDGQHT